LIFNKLSRTTNHLEKTNDAIICYEQAIKFNTNKRAVTRAIYEITKIKIENRDYYEALYTLERAQYLDIDEKVIKKFKIFTNGVTSMMKKNYEEGVKILTELAEDKDKPLSNFLKPLFYSTRSYGHMALE
jgi:tetratricopeptide (TPR) repeat protein